MSFCVDVEALQRLSRSMHADADVLAAVDITATTDRAAAALPGSVTATAVVALAGPIHVAYDGSRRGCTKQQRRIEHHVRTCVESDLAAAQR